MAPKTLSRSQTPPPSTVLAPEASPMAPWSPTDKDLLAKAEEAKRKASAWEQEVRSWDISWAGWDVVNKKRRKVDSGFQIQIGKSDRTIKPAQDKDHKRGHLPAVDGAYDSSDDEGETWGGLSASRVRKYERRTEEISLAVEDLGVENLKIKVLSYPDGKTHLTGPQTKITEHTLFLLPILARLNKLLTMWSIRIDILRLVPSFLRTISATETLLEQSHRKLAVPYSASTQVVELNDLSRSQHRLGETDYLNMYSNMERKIAESGRLLDEMLDRRDAGDGALGESLELEPLPDAWISRMEDAEESFSSWVVTGRNRVLEGVWAEADEREKAERRLKEIEEQRQREAEEKRRQEEEERRRLEEERKRREEEERAKREAERRRREAEELKRLQEEEARMLHEREEKARLEREDAERRAAEAEEARRQAEEESERQKQEEIARLAHEEASRLAAEAAEVARLLREEAERQKREQEVRRALEEAQRQEKERLRLEELARIERQAAEKRAAEEEEARIRVVEEEERLKKGAIARLAREDARLAAEKAEAARLRREDEEKERLRVAELARLQREAAEKRAAEGEDARRRAAEEAERLEDEKQARLALEEAQRKEEERLRLETLARLELEAAEKRAAEEQRQRDDEVGRLAEEERKRQEEEDAARRVAELEAARRLKEEDELKLRQQLEEKAKLERLAEEERQAELARLFLEQERQDKEAREFAEKARVQDEIRKREDAERAAAEEARLRAIEQKRLEDEEATRIAMEELLSYRDQRRQSRAARHNSINAAWLEKLARDQAAVEAAEKIKLLKLQEEQVEADRQHEEEREAAERLADKERLCQLENANNSDSNSPKLAPSDRPHKREGSPLVDDTPLSSQSALTNDSADFPQSESDELRERPFDANDMPQPVLSDSINDSASRDDLFHVDGTQLALLQRPIMTSELVEEVDDAWVVVDGLVTAEEVEKHSVQLDPEVEAFTVMAANENLLVVAPSNAPDSLYVVDIRESSSQVLVPLEDAALEIMSGDSTGDAQSSRPGDIPLVDHRVGIESATPEALPEIPHVTDSFDPVEQSRSRLSLPPSSLEPISEAPSPTASPLSGDYDPFNPDVYPSHKINLEEPVMMVDGEYNPYHSDVYQALPKARGYRLDGQEDEETEIDDVNDVQADEQGDGACCTGRKKSPVERRPLLDPDSVWPIPYQSERPVSMTDSTVEGSVNTIPDAFTEDSVSSLQTLPEDLEFSDEAVENGASENDSTLSKDRLDFLPEIEELAEPDAVETPLAKQDKQASPTPPDEVEVEVIPQPQLTAPPEHSRTESVDTVDKDEIIPSSFNIESDPIAPPSVIESASAVSKRAPRLHPPLQIETKTLQMRDAEFLKDETPSPELPPGMVVPRIRVHKRRESQVSDTSGASKSARTSRSGSPVKGKDAIGDGTIYLEGRSEELDEFDQKVSSILQALPARMKFVRTPGKSMLPSVTSKSKPVPLRTSSRGSFIPIPKSRSVTPTLSEPPTPTLPRKPYIPTAHPSKVREGPSKVKLYHLHGVNAREPLKLYVRLVGEHGERVMVRIGGGWADLAEYLRDYVTHHASKRRGLSGNEMSLQEQMPGRPPLRSRTSTSSLALTDGASSRPSSPMPTLKPRASRRQLSRAPVKPQSFERPLNLGDAIVGFASESTSKKPMIPTTPVASHRRDSLSQPSSAEKTPSRPASRRDSFSGSPASLTRRRSLSASSSRAVSESPSAMPTPDTPTIILPASLAPRALGLAGPKTRKSAISAESKAWVDGMLGQVRKASAERRRVSSGTGGPPPAPPATLPFSSSMPQIGRSRTPTLEIVDDTDLRNSMRSSVGGRSSTAGGLLTTRKVFVKKTSRGDLKLQ